MYRRIIESLYQVLKAIILTIPKFLTVLLLIGTISSIHFTNPINQQTRKTSESNSQPIKPTGKIIFLSAKDTSCPDDGPCNSVIDIINADGTNQRHLISGKFDPLFMTLSPDQTRFLYVSPLNGNRDIFSVNISDGQVTQLTFNKNSSLESLSWSPSGDKIVFSAQPVRGGNTTERSGKTEIYVMNMSDSSQKRLTTNNGDDFDPLWSPDGKYISFVSDRDGHDKIYIINNDGSNQRSITNDSAYYLQVDWSPYSRLILFEKFGEGNSVISTIDINTSEQTTLTDKSTDNYGPAWSPDGSLIAFNTIRENKFEIYLMNADGTDQHQITNLKNAAWPFWSPDGNWIAFGVSTNNIAPEIYVMMPDGTNLKRVTYGGARGFIWVSSSASSESL